MNWQGRWQNALMNNYGTPPVLIARGVGSRVWDDSGKDYIDMIAGIAVNAVGHAHPVVVEAISKQLSILGHTSNLVATNGPIELAERLLALLQAPSDARVFFCNSGTEANEAAFKLGRLTGRVHTVVRGAWRRRRGRPPVTDFPQGEGCSPRVIANQCRNNEMSKSAKQKPHKGLLKRLRVGGTGTITRKQAGKGHLMSSKTGKRRRHLGSTVGVSPSEIRRVRRMLGLA